MVAAIPALLDAVGVSLLTQARAFLSERTVGTTDRETFLTWCRERAGMIDISWCERAECEAAVKAATSATTRNVRPTPVGASCVACGEPARVQAYFAQSY